MPGNKPGMDGADFSPPSSRALMNFFSTPVRVLSFDRIIHDSTP